MMSINNTFLLLITTSKIILIFSETAFIAALTTKTSYNCRLSSSLSLSSVWTLSRHCHTLRSKNDNNFDLKERASKNNSRCETPTIIKTSIPEELVKSLDLIPLLEEVARYTSTKRGRDAILSLLGNRTGDGVFSKNINKSYGDNNQYNMSTRKTLISSLTRTSSNTYHDNYNVKRTQDQTTNIMNYNNVIKLSSSVTECKDEWDLIREAMNIIQFHNGNNNVDKSNDDYLNNIPPLPPIYPKDSSLWNTNDQVDTDDDEWLHDILKGGWGFGGGSLELENILQADQLINRIIQTHMWCVDMKERAIAPMIAKKFDNIDIEKLDKVYDEIKGCVIVKKGGISYQDPEGTKSYLFELDHSRFPALYLLKEKEDAIMEKINGIMQKLMSSRKFMSQLFQSDGKVEPYDLNGRIVVSVRSREVASNIGTIRSNSKSSHIYVEPKEIIHLGDELASIRNERTTVENQITNHISSLIARSSTMINKGLDAVASIDVIFARAAFGNVLNGFIPHVCEDGGVIKVEKFIHPILAMKRNRTVPIDLFTTTKSHDRSLIISGPNAGGKTIAMKSFGMVAVMNKLAIPIPVNRQQNEMRVDFFQNIFVQIGDNQNIEEGESTYVAKLNALSRIVDKVSLTLDKNNLIPSFSLILLDELGDGTDPEAGGCIAQALLEKIMESRYSITVSTTHSTRLKALSLTDQRFAAASVLLQDGTNDSKLPTYRLSYGTVGQSHALSAAARIRPQFPKDLLERAEYLLSSSQDEEKEELSIITEALEREKMLAYDATEVAKGYEKDSKRCKDALIMVTKAYDQQFSRLETRLEELFTTLRNDENRNSFEVIGESLSTVRLVKKKIKTLEEELEEKGLRMVSENEMFLGGESVTIIAGVFEGERALISHFQDGAGKNEVIVEIDKSFDWIGSDEKTKLTMKKKDLAVWDYPDEYFDWDNSLSSNNDIPKSVPDSRSRLFETLSSIKKSSPTLQTNNQSGKKFKSSRERKAATVSKKRKK